MDGKTMKTRLFINLGNVLVIVKISETANNYKRILLIKLRPNCWPHHTISVVACLAFAKENVMIGFAIFFCQYVVIKHSLIYIEFVAYTIFLL